MMCLFSVWGAMVRSVSVHTVDKEGCMWLYFNSFFLPVNRNTPRFYILLNDDSQQTFNVHYVVRILIAEMSQFVLYCGNVN